MTWPFGVSEVTTFPWSFEEDLARYAQLGATAIEIWEFKLSQDAAERKKQLASPHAYGLRVSSFQAKVHSLFPTRTSPQPPNPKERCKAMLAMLDVVAPQISGAVFVLNTGIAPGGNVQRAFETSVELIVRLARRAREHGVRLALEPLHPLAMNEDSFAWNLEDAMELVTAVADPVFGVCADAWNLARQHDLRARLARCVGKIFIAQISDFRRPRSFLDRLVVGDGSLDFKPFVRGLCDAQYDGPLILEIFSNDVVDSLYDGDVFAVVARSHAALQKMGVCH